MSNKKTITRLSKKPAAALKEVYDSSYKSRAKELEKINEYGFAILLYWNKIEALIKLLKYHKNIDKNYPDKLDFISRNWGILKNLHQLNSANYILVFSNGRKNNKCLWGVRDRVAHASHTVIKEDYYKYKTAATWVFNQLFTNMPETLEEARKQYLAHKKKAG